MEPESDAALLARIRAGDGRAFAEIYERYKRPLYAFCCRLLTDRARAEDAVHDVFVKLHEGARNLEQPERLRFWLFAVARNEAFMSLRRNGRETLSHEECVWDEETPLSILVEKDVSGLVLAMVNKLKVEYREVLFLREYDSLSYAEIASVTGDTESAVKSRLFKARRALAEKLSPLMKEREQ